MDPEASRNCKKPKADILRNVQAGTPDRRLVDADLFDEKAGYRINGQHEGRQRAVADSETIEKQH